MKKILKLLTIILLLAVVQTASAEDFPEKVKTSYIDADGASNEVEAIVLTGSEPNLEAGWYVAAGVINFSNTIFLSGDVHLILADGANMTVRPGVDNAGIVCSPESSLTIYGQSAQPGTLVISDCVVGIMTSNSIIINGGQMAVFGKGMALSCGHSLVINGGEINLESQEDPAIAAYSCTINGGKLKATVISAGEITLGCSGSDDYIEVSSFIVENTFSIAEGQMLTDGENYYSGILSDEQIEALAGQKLMRADVVYFSLPGSMEVIGEVTLQDGKFVDKGREVKFKFRSGFTLDGDVKMNDEPLDENDGVYTVIANDAVTITAPASVTYIDESGNNAVKNPDEYTILTGSETDLEAGWYVAAGDVDFSNTINLSGDVHLILADGANMTVRPGVNNAGLINNGTASLSIYGQSAQPGVLTISDCWTGISADNFTINGGKVNITPNHYAVSVYNGKIVMNGGKLNAITNTPNCFAINANNITIAFASSDDYIEASSYYPNSAFSIAEGQMLTDGENYYSGILSDEQIEALAGQKLMRATDVVYFSLPGCMEVIGEVTLQDGKFVDKGTEVKFKLRSGFTLDGDVKMNDEPLDENDGVYTVIANDAVTITASASVTYIDESGNNAVKNPDEYTILTGSETDLEAGWYVAAGDVDFSNTINLSGDVHLILADGANMTVTPGVNNHGLRDNGTASLSIYGQSAQPGALTISDCSRGIEAANFTINGGKVNITPNVSAVSVYNGKFVMNGGEIVANSYVNGFSECTINGGKMDIKSQYIVLSNSDGPVVINGGEINIESQSDRAISVGSFTINGGKLKAITNATNNFAIYADEINISFASSNDYIEASSYNQYATFNIGQELTDGKYFYSGTLGGVQIKDLAGKKLVLSTDPVKFFLPQCMEITNNVIFFIEGEFVQRGTEVKFKLRSGLTLDGDVKMFEEQLQPDDNGVYTVIANYDVMIEATAKVAYINAAGEKDYVTDFTVLTGEEEEIGVQNQETWYVVNETITFDHTLNLDGNVHLILADGTTMSIVTEGNGIVGGNEDNGSLSIYAQSNGESMGSLQFDVQENSIFNSSLLSINGGKISANGAFNTNGGVIEVNGGDISIECNTAMSCSSFSMNGGTVNVKATQYAIYCKNGTVTMTGGTFDATSSEETRIYADDKLDFQGGNISVSKVRGCIASISFSGVDDSFLCNSFCPDVIVNSDALAFADDGTASLYISEGTGYIAREVVDKISGKTLRPAYEITVAEGITLSDNCFKVDEYYYYTTANTVVAFSLAGYENPSVIVKDAANGNVEVTEKDGEYTFTMPDKDVTISVEDEKVIFNEGALKVIEIDGKKTAIIDGAYSGADGFTLKSDISVDEVTFSREFSSGVSSTIILPFAIANGQYTGGDFYKFSKVSAENGEWTADAYKVTSVEAHTPYLFVPNGETFAITGSVTLQKNENVSTSYSDDNWTFTGVYQRKRWGADAGDNKDYCFAANPTDDIHPGDFVKIGIYVQLKPFRCYLTNNSLSKSGDALPQSINVRIVDETASVIDNPADPVDEHNGDIETPVSEIVPVANVNVWSYDKTIYISAAAGTNYRIIDANGRALATGVTATDRDEIRLGNRSGIVIVIINGKTFKLNY